MTKPLDLPTTRKQAWDYVCGLSKPSKMPGYGYGLPAQKCNVGSRLRKKKNSVCSDCYALKGNYVFSNVKAAQERRLASIDKPYWIPAMTLLINFYRTSKTKMDTRYFRWHDSGDIQSYDHLLKIISVVRATPDVKHWLPTRELGLIVRFLKDGHKVPRNLVIRLSAAMIGKMPPINTREFEAQGIAFSGVDLYEEGVAQCEAYTRGGDCGSCRSCWDTTDEVKIVSYPRH